MSDIKPNDGEQRVGWRQLEKDAEESSLGGLSIEAKESTDAKAAPLNLVDFPTQIIDRIKMYVSRQAYQKFNDMFNNMSSDHTEIEKIVDPAEREVALEKWREDAKKRDLEQDAAGLEAERMMFGFSMVCKTFRGMHDDQDFRHVTFMAPLKGVGRGSMARAMEALLVSKRCRKIVKSAQMMLPWDIDEEHNDQRDKVIEFCLKVMDVLADCPNLERLHIQEGVARYPPGDPSEKQPVLPFVKIMTLPFPVQGYIDFTKFPSLKMASVAVSPSAVFREMFGFGCDESRLKKGCDLSAMHPNYVIRAPNLTDLELRIEHWNVYEGSTETSLSTLGHLVVPKLERVVVLFRNVGDDKDYRMSWIEEGDKGFVEEEYELPTIGTLCTFLQGHKHLKEVEINIRLKGQSTSWDRPDFLPKSSSLLASAKAVMEQCPELTKFVYVVGKEHHDMDFLPLGEGVIDARAWKQLMRVWVATVHTAADGKERFLMVEGDYTIQTERIPAVEAE